MDYFWHTSDTIPAGVGFSHFDRVHLGWLAAFATVTVVSCIAYRRMNSGGRSLFRQMLACLLIADELFKLIPMLFLGTFRLAYLPFQLCSINIFLIVYHAWRSGKVIGNFLYTVCIPGALAALLFPSWTKLPGLNYMCIHSFTVHILLILYPVVLTAAGEIRPEVKLIPKSLLLLLALAGVALLLNLLWDTNFMFLMYVGKGNPLYLFEKAWGSHLLGFPVIIAGVIVVLHAPWILYRKLKKR
ncbi:MAG: YwaF family protein [Oscillospiraceae bacterium]|nr:YwaF family protein [Oscillospiraceae bacterium]